jgi:hypothetical protein
VQRPHDVATDRLELEFVDSEMEEPGAQLVGCRGIDVDLNSRNTGGIVVPGRPQGLLARPAALTLEQHSQAGTSGTGSEQSGHHRRL